MFLSLRSIGCLSAMVLSGVALSAQAGFLAGDAAALLHGSAAFANELGPIHAIVDYAAYAPGTFDVPEEAN